MNNFSFGMSGAKKWKMAAFVASITSVTFLLSCEDTGILRADKSFIRSNLKTVFSDTFSIVSSTVQLDSLPSTNSPILLGSYTDDLLGRVTASNYFQIGPQKSVLVDTTRILDSVALILPYSKYWYGDTTTVVNVNVHELTKTPIFRVPYRYPTDDRVSMFYSENSFYNSNTSDFNPIPIVSKPVLFNPISRDNLRLKFPTSLGQKWFRWIQKDTLQYFSSNLSGFQTNLFKGIHLAINSANASIVGFRSNRARVKFYYRALNLAEARYDTASLDFPLTTLAFNNIVNDRSGTQFANLAPRKELRSNVTGNNSFIQSGGGLVTKLEFPRLKGFLQNKNIILLDAILELYPNKSALVDNVRPPRTLQFYATDASNVPIFQIGGNSPILANISYDREYQRETKYVFPMTNYINNELLSTNGELSPVLVAPPTATLVGEVNRVAITSKLGNPNSTKLKIFYSYVTN